MQYLARIMAIGNLLGFLAYVAGFLLIYPNATEHQPLSVVLLNILNVAVFLSQRSYAWLMARQWGAEDNESRAKTISPFDFWTEWMEHPLFPRLLIVGNLILAVAAGSSLQAYLAYLDQFQNVITDFRLSPDISPEMRFLAGFDCWASLKIELIC